MKLFEKLAQKQRQKVYAVDFDGTIVENAYPRIGKLKPKTVDFIKRVHDRGDRVVIWTSRHGKPREQMEHFLVRKNVPFHEINTNSKFRTGSPKIIADYYIDDKAVHVDDLEKIASYKEGIEKVAKAKSKFQQLKKYKVQLTPEERKACMDAKAVWHFNGGSPSPAVWKSVSPKGEVTYVTNTHRAYNTAPTLKGAISRYHKFIKSTA